MKNVDKICIYIGILTIFLIFGFVFYFCYINEPIGDDVLGYFTGSLTAYLDDTDLDLGYRISNLKHVFMSVQNAYLYWTGRIPCYIFTALGKLVDPVYTYIVIAIMFVGNLILALRCLYGNLRDVVLHPTYFLVLFLAMYWVKPRVYYDYMWTMAAIYSFTILVGLIYYNFFILDSHKKSYKPNYFLMTMCGFLLGYCHEVLSLCFIVLVMWNYFIDIFINKEKWQKIFQHTGLFIGYVLCIFSPGNFYRMHQSHDLINIPYWKRLLDSIGAHFYMIGSHSAILLIIVLGIALISLGYLIRRKEIALKDFAKNGLLFLILSMCSIFVWGYVSHVPVYGLGFWIILVYITLFGIIDATLKKFKYQNVLQSVCAVIMIVVLSIVYYGEIKSVAQVSNERKILIREAVKNNQKSVVVPKYPKKLSKHRYLLKYLNERRAYSTVYYIKYYGTEIIPE